MVRQPERRFYLRRLTIKLLGVPERRLRQTSGVTLFCLCSIAKTASTFSPDDNVCLLCVLGTVGVPDCDVVLLVRTFSMGVASNGVSRKDGGLFLLHIILLLMFLVNTRFLWTKITNYDIIKIWRCEKMFKILATIAILLIAFAALLICADAKAPEWAFNIAIAVGFVGICVIWHKEIERYDSA